VPEARPYAGGVLKVSQKLEYAMRAMIELARHNDEGLLLSARQIAERQQIPLRFLEQQLGALHKNGLVESFRGSGGGCRLSRAPEDITVADIAAAIEGQVFPMGCLEPTDHTCFADSRCGLQGFWGDVAQAIDGVFRQTTVADLVVRQQELGPLLIAPETLLSRLN
jgi:Rrf2 family protein